MIPRVLTRFRVVPVSARPSLASIVAFWKLRAGNSVSVALCAIGSSLELAFALYLRQLNSVCRIQTA